MNPGRWCQAHFGSLSCCARLAAASPGLTSVLKGRTSPLPCQDWELAGLEKPVGLAGGARHSAGSKISFNFSPASDLLLGLIGVSVCARMCFPGHKVAPSAQRFPQPDSGCFSSSQFGAREFGKTPGSIHSFIQHLSFCCVPGTLPSTI